MLILTTIEATPRTVDLLVIGVDSCQRTRDTRIDVSLFGDGSSDAESTGDMPARYHLSGQFRTDAGATLPQSGTTTEIPISVFERLDAISGLVVDVFHGATDKGKAVVGPLRQPRMRTLDNGVPIQKWSLELIFKAGGGGPLGKYVAPARPTPEPPPGER